MDKAKKLLMVGVIAIALFISVGYATLSQDLREVTKSGKETSALSDWNVEIIRIEPIKVTGLANAGTPTFNKVSATFNADLLRAGDSVTYNVTIRNSGKVTARLDNVDFVEQEDGSPAIKYSVTNPTSILEPGALTTMVVTATYDSLFVETPDITSKMATSVIKYLPAN